MANVGTAAAGKTLIGSGQGASPTFASIGTNSGLTSHGVLLGEGNNPFAATAVGTLGQVLVSNGPGADPSFQNASSIAAPPIGALQYFSTGGTDTTYVSPNWLLCDGSIVSQATYSTLFSRVGLINGQNNVWTRQTPFNANNISALVYGASTYAFATSVYIYTSANGTTWTLRPSGTASTINALVYGSVFVFGANGGGISTSTDMITFTARTSGTSSNITALAYSGAAYVYSGVNIVASSTDAITWTARRMPVNSATTYNAITYGNGIFVIGGAGGATVPICTSTDGTTWDTKIPLIGPASNTQGNTALIYAGGQFVSCATDGLICTSSDGVRWIARITGTTSTFSGLVYALSTYVAGGGNSGIVYSSSDAVTWTSRTSNTASYINAVAFGNSTFVYGTINGGGGTSTDGTSWVAHNTGSGSNVNTITYGTVFSYGFNGGGLRTSTDGITFTAQTSGTASAIYSIIYANNLYTYCGAGGAMATSTDSVTWTQRTSGITNALLSMTYGTVYVAVGSFGSMCTSTDAITWTVQSSNTTSTLHSVIYQGGLYYAAGSNTSLPYLFTSTDAVTWSKVVQLPLSNGVNGLAYGNEFVATGQTGLIATSTDALTWTLRSIVNGSSAGGVFAQSINALTYANGRYTGVGSLYSGVKSYGTIITSTDATTWYSMKNSSVTTLNAIVYGTIYVAGGNAGELISSTGTYSYNSVTSFQLPNDNGLLETDEVGNNYIKKLYIKAL